MYKERAYRSWTGGPDLVAFGVMEGQTDLAVYAETDLSGQARAAVLTYRRDLEDYIKSDPAFYSALEPVTVGDHAPQIVRAMASAAQKAGVGPMAAVAGAFAEFVGRDLCRLSGEVIVENGGDIFIRTAKTRTVGIYAGELSPFTGKLAMEVGPAEDGMGVCTSSGTVSHSLSFGSSDAIVIISKDAALADAAATAAGNVIRSPDDIAKGVDVARSIEGVLGVVAIAKDKMGSWGDIRFV
jgi:ApbE superfamily uncharacterized protein (UPF0280 family)